MHEDLIPGLSENSREIYDFIIHYDDREDYVRESIDLGQLKSELKDYNRVRPGLRQGYIQIKKYKLILIDNDVVIE